MPNGGKSRKLLRGAECSMGEFRVRSACLMILIAVLAISMPAQAQKKKKPAPKEPQDAIEVVGHIPMTSGTVTSFLTTQHYSSYYLYVEHEGGKEVTLIDISKADKPVVLAEVAIEVVGHIPMTSGTVTSFQTTQHYSSYYLYVEHEGGKEVTLIDISKADKPVVLAEVAYPVADR